MKMSKTAKRIISIGALAVVILIALVVYNLVLTSDEEAVLTEIRVPSETRSVKGYLDIVERSKLRWKNAVTIRGWLGKESPSQDPRDLYLVLKSKDETLVYKVAQANLSRPDVTKALKLDPAITDHGFVLTLPLKAISGKTFKVGFIIEDKTGKYYGGINKNLTIPEDGSLPPVVEKGSDPPNMAGQVAVKMENPTAGMNYYFDKVEKSGDFINVIGWAFLKGMNASSGKIYILLKKDKENILFDSRVRVRKDVAKAFPDEKNNLDSCGFVSSIPTDNLPKGKYQVGLYLVNGNQTGNILTKKFVEIAE